MPSTTTSPQPQPTPTPSDGQGLKRSKSKLVKSAIRGAFRHKKVEKEPLEHPDLQKTPEERKADIDEFLKTSDTWAQRQSLDGG
ncbi:hypothetical protein RUND412_008586, partial [Rhizina undulata]